MARLVQNYGVMTPRALLPSVSLVLALFAVGCVAPDSESDAEAEDTASASGNLSLTTVGDYDVVGTWEHGDTLVQFESHVSEEGVASVKLVVDGAEFDHTFDYFTHSWESDGHKNTLFRAEINALAELENTLEDRGQKGRPWERLFTIVSQHAAAPPGYTFMKRAGSPSTKEEKQHREADAVWNDGVNYICRANNTHGVDSGYSGSGSNYAEQWGYNWATHDSLSGEGGSSRNTASGNQYHGVLWSLEAGGCRVGSTYHYADKTGVSSTSHTQPSSGSATSDGRSNGSCEGRCGAGCPRSYNYYFTWDCFDHDICGDFHPNADMVSYSGDCGYEFSDADGDWASGTSSGYYYDCPGSMGSSCADNGNAFAAGK